MVADGLEKIICIMNEDMEFLAGFEMVVDSTVPVGETPKAIWSTENSLSWPEDEIAMIVLVSIGINTLMKNQNYCGVMSTDTESE